MRRLLLPLTLLPALTASIACGATEDQVREAPAAAAPTASEAPAVEALSAEAMAKMMMLAQPGPEHEELMRYAGDWVGEVSIGSSPGGPTLTQTSDSTCRAILGGRFLELRSAGEFMGQPFEALSYIGYDRRNEVWNLIGLDTLGTYWVTGSGKREDDGVVRMHGRDKEPMGEQGYWFEIDFVDADTMVSSVWFSQQGPVTYDPPFKMVETTYRRKR